MLIDLVWEKEYWTNCIFDLKVYKTNQTNIEAMFLQLLAARFIVAKQHNHAHIWTIAREESNDPYPPYCYISSKNWAGVNFLPTSHIY